VKKKPNTKIVPVALEKIKKSGLRNVIFEVDVGDSTYNFTEFPITSMCELLLKWINWCKTNLGKESKILVNFRDLSDAMPTDADRVFYVVSFIASLPEDVRPMGLIFEDPRGFSLPEEVGAWSRHIRQTMDEHDWKGYLLVHVHEKFGFVDSAAIEVGIT